MPSRTVGQTSERWSNEPKNKTHSGAKKRFKLTGTGKVKHGSAMNLHKFEEKTQRA